MTIAFGQNSTLAAILIKESATLDIDDIADQILRSKIAQRVGTRSVTWDCDDLVFLDFANVRIALYDRALTEFSSKIVCLASALYPEKRFPYISIARNWHARLSCNSVILFLQIQFYGMSLIKR